MSSVELERAYREGRTTPTEVASRALRAAADLSPLAAFIRLDADEVHAAAGESTTRWRAGAPRSPLEGVPVAIKDQIDVAGLPTSGGTSFLRAPAERDAEVVARLKRAGAIVFGKTNLPELALAPTGVNPHHGTARNPWRPSHDSGGSSSGSAVAVASGTVPLALGTDMGGSVRIPAALCGVAALKPTFDRVPRDGVLPIAWSLEHVGVIGATVEDVRRAFAVIANGNANGNGNANANVRVGVCEAWWRLADADAVAAVDGALERIGAERVDVELPHVGLAQSVLGILCNAEAAVALERYRGEPLGPMVRLALALGRAVSAVDYVDAQRMRARIAGELAAALSRCDVLVTPTTAHAARAYRDQALGSGELDEAGFRRATAFTFPANLAGLPAAQVPCALDADGLPLGLQVIAPFGADALALAVAEAVERSTALPPPPAWRTLTEHAIRSRSDLV